MITRIRKVEPNRTHELETELTANGIEVVQKAKHPGGRPKIKLEGFSQKVIKEMMDLARIGMPYKSIAGCLNISYNKFLQLREENPEWAALMDGQREAFVSDNLAKLRRHANNSPQSAQWLLERVRPAEFSSKAELRVSGAVSNTLTLDVSQDLCSKLADARRANVDGVLMENPTTTTEISLATPCESSPTLFLEKNQSIVEIPVEEVVPEQKAEAP